jgi:hypothetical protein
MIEGEETGKRKGEKATTGEWKKSDGFAFYFAFAFVPAALGSWPAPHEEDNSCRHDYHDNDGRNYPECCSGDSTRG